MFSFFKNIFNFFSFKGTLHSSSNKGDIEAVKKYLDVGVSVNSKKWGVPPLALAAIRGHKEVAELLISKGANVNWFNIEGRTILDLVVQLKRKDEMVKILRRHGGKTFDELKAEGLI